MIIIHPGFPKCASTWLQKVVFTEGNGFSTLWPTHENSVIEEFAWTNPVVFDPDLIKKKYMEERENFENQFISHETLVGDPILGNYWGFEVASRLAEVFDNAKILLIFREQVSYIYSAWSEYVKRGGTRSVEKYALLYKRSKGYRPLLNLDFLKYDELYTHYANLFGRSNVLYMPLELLVVNKAEFIEKLEDFLGVNLKNLNHEKRYIGNRGFTTFILRHLNKFSIKDPFTRPSTFRKSVVNKLCDKSNRWLTPKVHMSLEENSRMKIKQHVSGVYKSSNSKTENICGIDLKSLGYEC